jgi:hypothetical protein
MQEHANYRCNAEVQPGEHGYVICQNVPPVVLYWSVIAVTKKTRKTRSKPRASRRAPADTPRDRFRLFAAFISPMSVTEIFRALPKHECAQGSGAMTFLTKGFFANDQCDILRPERPSRGSRLQPLGKR